MVAPQIDEKVYHRCFRVVGVLHEPHHKGVAWAVVDARFNHWDHRHSELQYHLHRDSERLITQPYGANKVQINVMGIQCVL